LGIGEAELGSLGGSFSIYKAVPFGVFSEIFVRRHKRVKGVTEPLVLDAATKGGGDDSGFIVATVAAFPERIEAREPISSAVFEGGLAVDLKIGNLEGPAMRNSCGPRRPPTDAALILEKSVHSIDRSSWVASGKKEMMAFDADDKFFGPETLQINVGKEF